MKIEEFFFPGISQSHPRHTIVYVKYSFFTTLVFGSSDSLAKYKLNFTNSISISFRLIVKTISFFTKAY